MLYWVRFLCAVCALFIAFSSTVARAELPQVLNGKALWRGHSLRSDKDAELRFKDGTTIHVAAGTRMRAHKDASLWLDSTGFTKTRVFTLLQGALEVRLPQKKNVPAVLVRTAVGLSGAVQSGYMAVVAHKKQSAFANHRGVSKVSRGGRWMPVAVGGTASLEMRAEHIVWSRLPVTSQPHTDVGVWLAWDGKATVGGFSWPRTPAVKDYLVTLSCEGAPVRKYSLAGNSLPGAWATLPPGIYNLQVQGKNAIGLAGPPSPPLRFNVVGIDGSTGARVASRGVVYTDLDGQARFSHVDGLLMSYGSAGNWARATETVPLYYQDQQLVRFRHPRSKDVATGWVRRYTRTASVKLGPKRATWPETPIRVSVSLGEEGPDTATPPGVEVMLGVEPLKLTWHHEGQGWWAEIAPQQGTGPWVVRAVVRDEAGIELGRDLVEITATPKPEPTKSKQAAQD